MKINHKQYLDLAFQLAEKNLGKTKLNPSVGSVVVKNHSVISTGVTSFNGRPHSEFNALSKLNVIVLLPILALVVIELAFDISIVPGSFDVNVYCGVLLSEEFGTGVISLITGRIISGNTVNEISKAPILISGPIL